MRQISAGLIFVIILIFGSDIKAQLSTVSGPTSSICPGSSVQLFTTPSGGTSYTYAWSPVTGLSNPTIANPIASPAVTTTYTVIVTDVPTSDTVSDAVTITVQNVPPPLAVIPQSDTLCAGDTLQLRIENTGDCSGNPGTCQSPSAIATIGSSTTWSQNQFDNPFFKQNNFIFQTRSSKRQIIITKAELNAAGILGARNISSLSFNFLITPTFPPNPPPFYDYDNFRIDMGCTMSTTFGPYVAGLTNVYTPKNESFTNNGWNEFVFDNAFKWDGQSNVVIEMCYVNPVATNDVPPILHEIIPGSNVARFVSGNTDVCGSFGGININRRPVVQLRHCEIAHTASLTYSWTPGAGLSSTSISNPLANPAISTAYEVTITDANGCFVIDTADITVAPNFNLSINSDTLLCGEDTLDLISTDNAGAGATYLWSSAAPIANSSIPVTTGYFNTSADVYLEVSNAGGCVKTDSFNVNFNAPVTLEILTKDTSICQGDSIPVVITTNSQGCQLSNISSCSSPQSIEFMGTSAFATQSVAISPYGSVGFGNNPGQKKQFIFLASELSGMTSSSILTSLGFNVEMVNAASSLRQGFTIRVGCTGMSQFPLFGGTFETGTQTVYTPKNINVSLGWNDYQFDTPYVWDGTSNIVVEVCWTNSSSLGFVGAPTVRWSNTGARMLATAWGGGGNHCAATNFNTTSFNRPSVRLNHCDAPPNPNYTYLWTPAAGISNDTMADVYAAPNTSTMYNLTATDPLTGCFAEDSIEIIVAPDFVTTVTPMDSVLCVADTVQLSVTHNNAGPVTYYWRPGLNVSDSSISNPLIYVSDAEHIISEVESSQGCIKWDTLDLNVQDALDVSIVINSATACDGDSVQFIARHDLACGRANGNYCTPNSVLFIGTGANSSSQNNITPFVGTALSGKRQLIISASELWAAGLNSSGQLASISFEISTLGKADYQNFQLKMGCTSSSQLSSTFQGNLSTVFDAKDVTLTMGINFFDFDRAYNWDGVSNIVLEVCYENTSIGSNSAVNFYWPSPNIICVTHTQGVSMCSATTGFVHNRRPNIGFKYCSYVPTNFNYTWSPSNLFADPSVQAPRVLLSQPGKYYLDLVDLNTNCLLSDSIDIPLASFSVQAEKDTTICSTEGYQLNLITDANQPNILWTPGNELDIDTIVNPTILIDNGTQYVANVWDSSGCFASDTVFITILPNPTIGISNDVSICPGDDVQLIGTGGNTYLWSPPAGLSNTSIPDPIASVSKSTTYYLEIANTIGCTDNDSVRITVHPSPVLDLGPDTSYCLGGYLVVSAGGRFASYRWQDNSTDSFYLASQDGKYWVNVIDSFSCPWSDTVEISLAPPPITDIRFITEVCVGDSAVLDALNPGSKFLWSTGETTQQITVRDSGFYWVEIDDSVCTSKDSTNVIILDYPISTLPRNESFCKKEDPFGVTVTAGSDQYRYYWEHNGQVNRTVTLGDEGAYYVTITNGLSCEIVRMIEVREFCSGKIFVPNSFTPNNDGINDVFKITAANLDEFEFHIFNRWGEHLFIATNPNFEWDGDKGGQPMPSDTYVWTIFYKIKNADGTYSELEEKGTVNLIR